MNYRWRLALIALMTVGTTAFTPCAAAAQKGRKAVGEGNRLFNEGRYAEAHGKYLDALQDAPDSPLIKFNDGNALYGSEEYQRALDAYREAVERGDPALVSKAWYNVGNALYRQQQLAEALEAYKQSLRADPTDIDAKHNLELVLEQLRQQQQQQQQQQQGQNQEEQEQQQEGQQPPPDQQERDQQQQQQDQQPQPPSQQQEQRQDQSREGQQSESPGQMTREEAERLLRAIEEDPSKVERQRLPLRGRPKPRKDW